MSSRPIVTCCECQIFKVNRRSSSQRASTQRNVTSHSTRIVCKWNLKSRVPYLVGIALQTISGGRLVGTEVGTMTCKSTIHDQNE